MGDTPRTRTNKSPVASVPSVPVIPRDEFVRLFGESFRSGHHVTMLGPTQRGKTTLGMQLLDKCCNEERKAVVLAGKPPDRDSTMAELPKRLNLRRIRTWPPTYSPLDRYQRRRGWVLQPIAKTNPDSEAEDKMLHDEYRKAMRATYASKSPRILFVDETAHVYEHLKLRREYEAPLMRGAPVVSVWSLIQRGRFISYHAYSAPEHIFIFYDPDKSNRDRYSDIGGVDPKELQYLAAHLKTEEVKSGMTVSQALYIRRAGPQLAIVDIH